MYDIRGKGIAAWVAGSLKPKVFTGGWFALVAIGML